jgi:hypothetical protein
MPDLLHEDGLRALVTELYAEANETLDNDAPVYEVGSLGYDVLMDAADALSDAIDLLFDGE